MRRDPASQMKPPARAAPVGLPRRREERTQPGWLDCGQRFEHEARHVRAIDGLRGIGRGRRRIDRLQRGLDLHAQRAAVLRPRRAGGDGRRADASERKTG